LFDNKLKFIKKKSLPITERLYHSLFQVLLQMEIKNITQCKIYQQHKKTLKIERLIY